MTVHKLKESIAVGQAGRGRGQRGGWWAVRVVHHYHGGQFCAQANKIRDVIVDSFLDLKWEEVAGEGKAAASLAAIPLDLD